MKIRLTKEFNFEMSHVLHDYDGLCRNIHGHSYRLFVTILGEPIDEKHNPKNGMVMDFGELKAIVFNQIVDRLDHALVIPNDSTMLSHLKSCDTKLVITDYQPTCENLLIDFAKRISSQLPQNVTLARLCLYETASSYAEWLQEDNN
ncbi:MAG: 6-carboxytetrahydropterin synthase [Bacteroidales bacterium]|jgi:6-pyruvoyltetrahydropterin/6-carboxytetrahydropterin synthase|nr:6-carboxytetrahydropterin synthase [Bacteroidales bacterium]MDD4702768.1 6-carboxytetrahydropterin synthase [Bacteroidales bacterium]MDX9798282.1 6-carboxytetrahydropterin synthase [Bacteroidales bacterium]